MRLRRLYIGVVLLGLLCGRLGAASWRQSGADFGGGAFQGTEVDSLGRLRLSSFQGINMALGAAAVSGQNTLRGSRSVTDGNPDTEWRFNNRAEVLGEEIRVDLGGERGVSRVRIVPGKTLAQRPRFFLKGYRFEVAPEAAPEEWVVVAQQVDNTRPLVDTTRDSTWIEVDAQGRPLPVLGRFVRLRIVREDPPNWVTVGEMEVFGEGFRSEGGFESAVFDAGAPVDVGRVRFAGQEPEATQLRLQFRTSEDGVVWPPWEQVPRWSLEQVRARGGVEGQQGEPARFLQYRVVLATDDPLQSPHLERVEVEFDPRLLASSVRGSIAPRRPMLGEETLFTYALEAVLEEGDLGFDRVRIGLPGEVEAVRLDGMPVPEEGYGWEVGEEGLDLFLAPEYRVRRSVRLEVDFRSVLLRPVLVVRAGVGLGAGGELQHGREAGEGAWTLKGRGILSRPLPRGSVRIRPNPFNAARAPAQIRIDVAKVQVAQPLSVRVYDLSGRRVRTLLEGRLVQAGRQRLEWDGRDDDGGLVLPGLYLVRVEIEADVGDVWVGAVGVVY